MKFPQSFLDEVKARFRASEYIGRTVQLKRAGGEFVGLSPFQKEKTPSFYVNDDKARFFDFSSGKNGDVVDFICETEGLSFVEAVTRLAQEAGVPLPERDAVHADVDRKRRRLEEVLKLAHAWFIKELAGPHGREAVEYLTRRGLSAADIERFGLGYSLKGNVGLMDHLLNNSRVTRDEAIAAGVLVDSQDGRAPYDRYRDRIMFPIRDAAGRLISFGGRALASTTKAKYLNGPDTDIFDKGKQLYGLDAARKLLAAGPGPLVVVEGYMDVIACQRAGIAACAPMGTALTEAQMELMWRFHPEPTLCLDGDEAGRRAAERAMDKAIPKIAAKRSLRFTRVEGGKDPDDVLRDRGPDVLRAQLSKGTPLGEAIFQREHTAAPLDTPERRAELRERLRKIVRQIGDKDIAREYGQLFRERLDAAGKQGKAPAQVSTVDAARALRTAIPPVLAALAYWMVKDPVRVSNDVERLSGSGMGHPAVDRLLMQITSWLMAHDPDGEKLAQHLQVAGLGQIVASLSDTGGRFQDVEIWRRAVDARVTFLVAEAAMEQAKDDLSTPEKMQNFMALKAQRDAAKKVMSL